MTLGLVAVAFVAAACNPAAPSFNRAQAIANYQAVFDAPGSGIAAVAAGSPTIAPTDLDVPGCDEGTVDATFEAHTLATVNYYREHVGLPLLVDDPVMSADAQRAALVRVRSGVDGLGGNPHDPFGSGHACVANGTTDRGQIGSARSNLSVGWTTGSSTPAISNGPRGIRGQFRDNGGGPGTGIGNETVGHRAGMMSPLITRVGAGSAAWYDSGLNRYYSSEALYWMDRDWFADPDDATSSLGSGFFSATRPTDIDYIAWPPPGYTPDTVTYPRFSFSLNMSGGDVDFSGASVTMAFEGQTPVPIGATNFTNIPAGFLGVPDDVLVWEPDLSVIADVDWATSGGQHLNADVTGADKRFRIDITNVLVNGVSTDYFYVVFIMDADQF